MRGVVTASADRAAKVVRFALSEDEARASWLTWAKRQRFFPETLKHQGAIAEARAEWLPFYCFKVRASTVYKAEVLCAFMFCSVAALDFSKVVASE